jgi:raffinose/stachyose/melibiose transport system substrate-binding protein
MTTRLSRRDFLKATAGAGGAVVAAATNIGSIPVLGQDDYQGKFVIMSAGEATQHENVIAGIEGAFPGIEIEWRSLTSERYTELFAAAEIAGDQIDFMDLNGQDLRRYAVGGRLKDLSNVDYLDRFRPIGLETYTIGGKLWAIPNGGISGFPFFVNKKALDAIGFEGDPESYQELLDMADDLKAAGYAPFTHSGQNIYLWPVWQFWAYAQTSGNRPVEGTWDVLAGNTKFTDVEHLAGLEILQAYTDDGMFIDGVNGMDTPAAELSLTAGSAAFWYHHSSWVGTYRSGDFAELDLSFVNPLRSVEDETVRRQLPGGTGWATGIYSRIAPEREQIAMDILKFVTGDDMVALRNEVFTDAVSTNIGVQPSDDPLAVRYGEISAPNQFVYLDWYWPPEITRVFQEQQQGIVAKTATAGEAAASIQAVLDELYAEGYEFEI